MLLTVRLAGGHKHVVLKLGPHRRTGDEVQVWHVEEHRLNLAFVVYLWGVEVAGVCVCVGVVVFRGDVCVCKRGAYSKEPTAATHQGRDRFPPNTPQHTSSSSMPLIPLV